MGKVRTEYIKRLARELIDRFPSKFSDDFESNKQAVSEFVKGTTTKVRNRIAGYITHVRAGMDTYLSSEDSEENGQTFGADSTPD
ncbi:30S ribosomal protein S17e [Candidatus Bathyarchaeota archaeon]|nr:30S ribosomal protein S17e [Candidatus Bathyarchaeota archaeon]